MILRSIDPVKCRSEIGIAMNKRNQYPDILPYDFNRVILKKLPNDEDSHYINASYVNVSVFYFISLSISWLSQNSLQELFCLTFSTMILLQINGLTRKF